MNISINTVKIFFKDALIKRNIPEDCSAKLSSTAIHILSDCGLPCKQFDFSFENKLLLKNNKELIVGNLGGEIVLNFYTGHLYLVNEDFFLASSLENLLFQIYSLSFFWQEIVGKQKFGNYQTNHEVYAFELSKMLLSIDKYLLINDNAYYWGSIIEDIENGIVGN